MGLGSAVVSGAGLVLAFPPHGFEVLAWIAFVPLLLFVHARCSAAAWQSFLAGLAAGLVFFGGVTVWTLRILLNFLNDSTVYSLLVFALLAGFLATVYFGGFALLARRAFRRWGAAGWLSLPALWVALELIRSHFFIGFPWGLLGTSQYRVLPILQSASVWGVYGLSFLVVAVNAALAAALTRDRRTRSGRLLIAGTVALVLVCGIGGALALRGDGGTGRGFTVGVVQPSVPQDLRWNPELTREIMRGYVRMTEEVVARGADLVVWPETATPLVLADPRVFPEMRRLVARLDVEMIVGSLRKKTDESGATRIYNSAYLIRRDGSSGEVYDKVVLTPFGEYIPYRRWMPFMPQLAGELGEMTAAPEPNLLRTSFGAAGVFTCYEGVYPHLASWATRKGARFLINPSNEAWHKEGLGRVQLMAQSLVRAVENRRYLVRSVNTGTSAIIDPYGRILALAGENEEAVLVGTIEPRDDRTLFARGGRYFPVACLLVGLAAVVGRRRAPGSTASGTIRDR